MSSIRTQILDAAETAERHVDLAYKAMYKVYTGLKYIEKYPKNIHEARMAQHEIPIVEKQLSMLNSMILKARD
jgi:hypothetical protein